MHLLCPTPGTATRIAEAYPDREPIFGRRQGRSRATALAGNRLAALLIAALSIAALPEAFAADAATDAIQAAYPPYREALFRTNTKSQPESERAVTAARAAWKQVRERFAGNAPVPYDRDNQFAATLAEVDAEAPAALRAQAGFGDALREVQAAVAALRLAILATDVGAAKRSIATLKGPFSRLFLRFG